MGSSRIHFFISIPNTKNNQGKACLRMFVTCKMKFLNLLFFAIPESEYEFIRYRNKQESTAFSVFSENGAKVKFLKLQEAGYTALNPNPEEYFFKGKNKFFNFPLSMFLFIRKEKPDVLFVHGFVFPFQLLCLKWFIPSYAKIIVQHHAERSFDYRIKYWFQKWAYPKADAYLFASRNLAQPLIDHKVITDSDKIYEVMECSTFFKKKDKTEMRHKLNIISEKIFLWVGRLDENKDPLTALKAFKMYADSFSDFKFYMIYGTSDLEQEVKDFVEANGLSNQVVLLGKVQHEQLENWYNAADYLISASHYESAGLAVGEAMACGCVPILTRIPAFITILDGGSCGYSYEVGKPEELTEVLLGLNEKDRKVYEQRVIEKFNKDLSFEAIGRRIYEIALMLTGK